LGNPVLKQLRHFGSNIQLKGVDEKAFLKMHITKSNMRQNKVQAMSAVSSRHSYNSVLASQKPIRQEFFKVASGPRIVPRTGLGMGIR
jgi:hypothetical protein